MVCLISASTHQIPSDVRNLVVTSKAHDSVSLKWDPPATGKLTIHLFISTSKFHLSVEELLVSNIEAQMILIAGAYSKVPKICFEQLMSPSNHIIP